MVEGFYDRLHRSHKIVPREQRSEPEKKRLAVHNRIQPYYSVDVKGSKIEELNELADTLAELLILCKDLKALSGDSPIVRGRERILEEILDEEKMGVLFSGLDDNIHGFQPIQAVEMKNGRSYGRVVMGVGRDKKTNEESIGIGVSIPVGLADRKEEYDGQGGFEDYLWTLKGENVERKSITQAVEIAFLGDEEKIEKAGFLKL